MIWKSSLRILILDFDFACKGHLSYIYAFSILLSPYAYIVDCIYLWGLPLNIALLAGNSIFLMNHNGLYSKHGHILLGDITPAIVCNTPKEVDGKKMIVLFYIGNELWDEL